jgi:hypothetical protein
MTKLEDSKPMASELQALSVEAVAKGLESGVDRYSGIDGRDLAEIIVLDPD